EDFDHDQDVDLLLGGKDAPTLLFSSLRRGRFEKLGPERTKLPSPLPIEPLAGDFDHDGIADLLAGRGETRFLHGRGDDTFEEPPGGASLPDGATLSEPFDADLDGQPDLVAADADGHLVFVSGVGHGVDTVPVAFAPEATAARAPILDDADFDGAADVFAIGETGASYVPGVRD